MKSVAEVKCEAKTRFASQELAEVNAARVMAHKPSQKIRTYKCPICSYWHLTSKPGGKKMRGLSLWEPWATLMAIGSKKVETRSWSTDYRGLVAICATKHFPKEAQELCAVEPFKSALANYTLARGCIVAVAELTDCRLMRGIDWTDELSFIERAFGVYEPGRYGWIFKNVQRLKTPMPFSGMQGLFGIEPGISAQIYKEITT